MRKELEGHAARPSATMLFRSAYAEDVRGAQGSGPNFEAGGNVAGTTDRDIRSYFDWLRENLGRRRYP